MISHESHGLTIYRFEKLVSEPGLVHFVSSRRGGVSRPPYNELNFGLHVGDRDEDVLTNRHLLMEHLGIPLAWGVIAKQVHAGKVTVVTSSMKGSGTLSLDGAIGGSDALVTDEANVCLLVMQADCVPVILYDQVRSVVGIAHSGWKGTVAGVTTNTVKVMIESFGSKPEDIIAAIGPSIGPDRYEVGPEVVEVARAAFPGVDLIRDKGDGKGYFDLWSANSHQLIALGIPTESIEVAGLCTYTHSDTFYSEREQRPTGRFVAGVMLDGN